MAWDRVSPQFTIKQGENYAGRAFTVRTGDIKDLFQYDGPDVTGGFSISLGIKGFNSIERGKAPFKEPFPIVRWALHAGDGCIYDDEPIAAGATYLTSDQVAKKTRQGLLWQVSGRAATSWILRGYCVLDTLDYELLLSATISPLPPNTAFPTVVAGNMIG